MKVKALKFTKKITDFTEISVFHGRRPISRKMSRPCNRESGWSLTITGNWTLLERRLCSYIQEDELSEQQIRLGLVEKRLENATKDADDRVDNIQQKLDDTNFEIKRKDKYALSHTTPSVWNSLPAIFCNTAHCKWLLKTHLFQLSMPTQLLVLLLHPFNGSFSRTTWVSRYQKGKTSLDLNEARDDGVLGCNSISWTICKQSAPRCRQITTSAFQNEPQRTPNC